MKRYTEVWGDLIELALQGKFDVIGHGCNCFCTMGAGIAPQMAKNFNCNEFQMELTESLKYDDEGNSYVVPTNNKGNINKLGTIDYELQYLWFNHPHAKEGYAIPMHHRSPNQSNTKELYVVNIYSQYHYGKNHKDGVANPLDYEALTIAFRKMNHIFKDKTIGLPMIGAGLAGGDWNRIKKIIQTELKDCDITVVKWNIGKIKN
jgi:O-acetyl-ADP-ribose deacetylase (regulator of RNase III)